MQATKKRCRFELLWKVEYGQNVYLCGSPKELGNWDQSKAAKMVWNPGHSWTLELDLPAGTHYYKYFVISGNNFKSIKWEEGENRIFQVKVSDVQFLYDTWKISDNNSNVNNFETENERLRQELLEANQKMRILELERAKLCGEGIGHLRLQELQALQNNILSAFMKVNKCIVSVVEKENCAVCYESERNSVAIPCGHFILCDGCAKSLKICPYCRKDVVKFQRVYM